MITTPVHPAIKYEPKKHPSTTPTPTTEMEMTALEYSAIDIHLQQHSPTETYVPVAVFVTDACSLSLLVNFILYYYVIINVV
jgi:hypothetical protein